MKPKPKVGDSVCVVLRGYRHSDPERLVTGTVEKVGREFFSVSWECGSGGSMKFRVQEEFYVYDWRQRLRYYSGQRCQVFPTESDYRLEKEREELAEAIYLIVHTLGKELRELPLESLRTIRLLLDGKTVQSNQPMDEDDEYNLEAKIGEGCSGGEKF